MTWQDVVDISGKVGLGVLVAAAITFGGTWITLARDRRKRYAERRRNLLEKVVDMLIEYEKTYRHQKAAFDWVATMQPADPEYPGAMSQFRDWDEKLRVAHEAFADASAILLLLGERKTEKALEKFRALAYRWKDESVVPSNATMLSNLLPLREQIITSREKLMSKLAAIYRAE